MNRQLYASFRVGSRAWLSSAALFVAAWLPNGLMAQANPFAGTWSQAFNHEVYPGTGGGSTDHLTPFHQSTPYVNFAMPYGAVHMSLIPRGKDRGKVIVWDRTAFIMQPGGSFPLANEYWSFQSWSIVDPAVIPTGPRFRNFVLPLHPMGTVPPATWQLPVGTIHTLFCAGHCWSPYGDLVVVGGASTGGGGIATVMLYRPDEVGQAWPILQGGQWTNDFTGSALYSGAHGRWNYGPALEWDRYYPTVTLTSRLTRTFGREVAIVTGGSEVIGQSFDMTTNPPSNPTWNTYEGLVLLDPTNTATPTGLAVDTFGTGTNVVRTFEGPDDQVQQNRLLEEYPRVHWIDSNEIVTSGYGPLSSKVQHEVPPIQPGAWSYSTGQSSIPMPGPNIPSFVHRHDGASVMFARYGALTNFIGRMGGFTEEFGGGAATSTTEYIPNAAGAPGTQWVQGPYMVQSRAWLNAVVLPDSTVVVVGGVPTREPTVATLAQWLAIAQGAELLVNGAFVTLPSATTPRGYHATAVLLPDGRVLVGGGEGRRDFVTPSFDYEIYSPWYMTQLRPSIMAISQSPSLGANPDGSTKVQYNSALTIDLTLPKFVGMGKIVLMAPGSVTHHSDMHARYVELEQIGAIIDMSSGVAKVVCSMPPEGLAPRGYYMVFAVTAGGVPSPAGWIQITN